MIFAIVQHSLCCEQICVLYCADLQCCGGDSLGVTKEFVNLGMAYSLNEFCIKAMENDRRFVLQNSRVADCGTSFKEFRSNFTLKLHILATKKRAMAVIHLKWHRHKLGLTYNICVQRSELVENK